MAGNTPIGVFYFLFGNYINSACVQGFIMYLQISYIDYKYHETLQIPEILNLGSFNDDVL